MSEHKKIIALTRKADEDASLRQALRNAKFADDIIKAAADADIELSADDVHTFQKQVADGELSDAELEHAAGGFLPYFECLNAEMGSTVSPEHWRL